MKTVSWIGAEIQLMIAFRDLKRLGQFPRTGTEPLQVFDPASFPHQLNPAAWLERPNQDDAIARPAFGEYVQHPVHPIVKINISRAGMIAPNELTRARAMKGVASLISLDQVGFALDHDARAFPPNKPGADQSLGARDRIGFKKGIGQHSAILADLLNQDLA